MLAKITIFQLKIIEKKVQTAFSSSGVHSGSSIQIQETITDKLQVELGNNNYT